MVPEERLEGPRQPAVAVGEVLAEQIAERGRCLLVGLGGPDQQPVELAADRVDVDS